MKATAKLQSKIFLWKALIHWSRQANCMPHNETKDVIKGYIPIKVTLNQDFTKYLEGCALVDTRIYLLGGTRGLWDDTWAVGGLSIGYDGVGKVRRAASWMHSEVSFWSCHNQSATLLWDLAINHFFLLRGWERFKKMGKHKWWKTYKQADRPQTNDAYNPYLQTILKEEFTWHPCTSYSHHVVKLQNC